MSSRQQRICPRCCLKFVLLTLLTIVAASSLAAQDSEGDPVVLAKMQQINDQLAAAGYNFYIGEIEFFTIGLGRPVNRIHQQFFRWVAFDPRRNADGAKLRYIVDESRGASVSGLSNAQTEGAIDRTVATWQAQRALQKLQIEKVPSSAGDATILDFFLGFGPLGSIRLADIAFGGWMPKAFFDALAPGGGDDILSASVTFFFLTDINGDNYLDTAHNEVYFNDNAAFTWAINAGLPAIDVQSAALHEFGHSLGLGHFGPPPLAVMNPIYAGIRQEPFPIDRAGLSTVWERWPN